MCEDDVKCGPCAEAKTTGCATRGFVLVEQATPEPEADEGRRLAIWGPFSAEIPSLDDKLVRLAAIERAIDQMIRRGRLSLNHEDQLVGEIHERLSVDAARMSPDARVRRMVEEVAAAHGGCLPTAFVIVTPAIADVFPRLRAFIGERVPFLAGTLYWDNRHAKLVWADVLDGVLDAFSITGTAWGRRKIEYCDPSGCRLLEEVPDLDLSTVTLASSTGRHGRLPYKRAMNTAAGFVVVQQAQGGQGNRSVEAPHVSQAGQEVTMAESAQAAPAPAAQAADTAPADQTNADAHEDALSELRRRVEDIEQDVATMKGDTPAKTEHADDTKEDDDMTKEGNGSEKEDDASEVTQAQKPAASPAPPSPEAIAQAVTAAVEVALAPYKPGLDQLLKQAAGPAAAKASTAEVKPVAQARSVATPDPSSPGGMTSADPKFQKLVQAADKGDVSAARTILNYLRPGAREM